MALPYYPEIGTIVICDYHGFVTPEMTKRRLAVVVSPRFRGRENLCTIVPFSTTAPVPEMPYHYLLHMVTPLPPPNNSLQQWVKGDMFSTVSLNRLDLPHQKDFAGKRQYITRVVGAADLANIRKCVLHALGFSDLTAHL